MNDSSDKEKERIKFEKELDEQEFNLKFGFNNYSPYSMKKNKNKNFSLILLISIVIFAIILSVMYLYAKKNFTTSGQDTLQNVYNALQVSVHNYCQENRKYPMTNQGFVDIDLLRNKGYYNLNVEVDYSYFMVGDKCRLIQR